MDLKDLLKKQLQTEKSAAQISQNKYTLVVERQTEKPEIKRALEEAYKVTVTKINSLKIPIAKRMLARYRYLAKGPSLKKMVITLKDGQHLDFGTEEKEKRGAKK